MKSNLDFVPYRAPQPQSLNAALEKLAFSSSPDSSTHDKGKGKEKDKGQRLGDANNDSGGRLSISLGRVSGQIMRQRTSADPAGSGDRSRSITAPNSPSKDNKESKTLWRSQHPSSAALSSKASSPVATGEPSSNGKSEGSIIGREISAPVFDAEATNNMSPVKMRNAGKPILVPPQNGRPSMTDPGQHDGAMLDGDLGQYFPKKRTPSLNTGSAHLFIKVVA